jgi:hypothetical protein
MTSKEKKELVLKKMANGDKRSYNELMADLELELWNERFKGKQGKLLSKKSES